MSTGGFSEEWTEDMDCGIVLTDGSRCILSAFHPGDHENSNRVSLEAAS